MATREILSPIANTYYTNLSDSHKTQIVATLSASIAHELRNYLGAILMFSELSVTEAKTDIKKAVKSAESLLSSLLVQIKGVVSGVFDMEDFKPYSLAKNTKEALDQYPFNGNERKLIALVLDNDFEYNGNSVLTTQIIYNLLKNALRAIKNAGKGIITIKLESGSKFNKLIFRDTASGIQKKFLSRMFNLFASQMQEQGGTGVGLAFCKTIMQSYYGGDITFDSIEGEYTEFVLYFPCCDGRTLLNTAATLK